MNTIYENATVTRISNAAILNPKNNRVRFFHAQVSCPHNIFDEEEKELLLLHF